MLSWCSIERRKRTSTRVYVIVNVRIECNWAIKRRVKRFDCYPSYLIVELVMTRVNQQVVSVSEPNLALGMYEYTKTYGFYVALACTSDQRKKWSDKTFEKR